MKLNQFTLPARMANKAACCYRTLKPKGRLSHAQVHGQRYTRERKLVKGGEPSQTLFLSPLTFLTSVHFPPLHHSLVQKGCKTRLAIKHHIGQVDRALYFLIPQGKVNIQFCPHCFLFFLALFLKLKNVHDLDFRLNPLFYLSYISLTKGIWAWQRLTPQCVGGRLKSLAGDMPQLVLQVQKDILAVSFPRERSSNLLAHLLCARSLSFHLVSQIIL